MQQKSGNKLTLGCENGCKVRRKKGEKFLVVKICITKSLHYSPCPSDKASKHVLGFSDYHVLGAAN